MKPDSTTPLSVMFVDDDADEIYLFNEVIEHSGLAIHLIKMDNVFQLLDYLPQHPFPDVIFLDINMPYKDGLEMLKELKGSPQYKDLHIVIYSTANVQSVVTNCYDAGAAYFVAKPEGFDKMVQAITKVCATDWKNFQRPPLDKGFVIS